MRNAGDEVVAQATELMRGMIEQQYEQAAGDELYARTSEGVTGNPPISTTARLDRSPLKRRRERASSERWQRIVGNAALLS